MYAKLLAFAEREGCGVAGDSVETTLELYTERAPKHEREAAKTTDEEIKVRAQEWEDSTWKGQLVELRAGRPRPSSEPNASLSFKRPRSGAEMIERAAELSGVKKPPFMREAALEKAARVLVAVG